MLRIHGDAGYPFRITTLPAPARAVYAVDLPLANPPAAVTPPKGARHPTILSFKKVSFKIRKNLQIVYNLEVFTTSNPLKNNLY
jgi:hypothetical protein